MKKLLSLFIISAMLLSLCACSTENNGADKNTGSTAIASHEVEDLAVEVLSCEYAKEVLGIDQEYAPMAFTERDGKVYINLTLKITNNSTETFAKTDILGGFEVDGKLGTLQYNLASVAPKKDGNDGILPGCIGIVNMLALTEEATMEKDITVNYTIKGKEFTEKVNPMDTRDALSKKTEVKPGDKINASGFYDIEVLSCTAGDHIYTSNQTNGKKYPANNGKQYIDLILKVKNNTDDELEPNDSLRTYLLLDNGDIIRANDRVEEKDNTELGYGTIKAGEEGIVHLMVSIDETVNTDGLAMRFNVANNCYYAKVQ